MSNDGSLIDWLKGVNGEYSQRFCSPGAQAERRSFWLRYPVGLFCFGCMDGRNNIHNATELPAGIMKNYRHAGPWEWSNSLDQLFYGDLMHWIDQGKECLVFVSYHFSKSNKDWGCAAFECNTDKAIASNISFKEKIDRVYGTDSAVFSVLLGFETDEESMIIHGCDCDQVLRVADLTEFNEAEIKETLTTLFPKFSLEVKDLLLRLISGNFNHVSKNRRKNRPAIALNHNERVVAVGQGLGWFYRPNQAIIIGMHSNKSGEAIVKAVTIVYENLLSGRISREKGFILLASASFRRDVRAEKLMGCVGSEERRACERAKENMRFALEVIEAGLPEEIYSELLSYMHFLTVITDLDTGKFIEVKDVNLD
ncbi:MAG: hypothetical protein WCK37_00560 [Candidatus Falkowbacteria bacterium]